jgi:hypothetical protein
MVTSLLKAAPDGYEFVEIHVSWPQWMIERALADWARSGVDVTGIKLVSMLDKAESELPPPKGGGFQLQREQP